MDAAHDSTERVKFILVHGTFATDAEWVREGSSFCELVRQHFEGAALFESFNWSGENSNSARVLAAQRLQARIIELKAKFSGKIVLVCHSHAGNIALYALREKRIDDAVAAVITLGTPFLLFEPKPVAERWYQALPTILAVLAGVFAMTILMSITASFFGEEEWPLVILPITVVIGLCAVYLSFRAARKYVQDSALPNLRAEQTRLGTTYGLAKLSLDRLLVVYVGGDEARQVLTTLSSVTSLPARVYAVLDVLGEILRPKWLILLYSVYLACIIIIDFDEWWADDFFIMVPFSFAVTAAAAFAMGVLIDTLKMYLSPLVSVAVSTADYFLGLALRRHRFSFGPESAAHSSMSHFTISSVPHVDESFTRLVIDSSTLPRSLLALRHSHFYSSDYVVGEMCKWLKRVIY